MGDKSSGSFVRTNSDSAIGHTDTGTSQKQSPTIDEVPTRLDKCPVNPRDPDYPVQLTPREILE